MHVLTIPSWYPRDDAPLLGSFFREQVEALAAAGMRVGVLASRHLEFPAKEWFTGPTDPGTFAEEGGVAVLRSSSRIRQPGPSHRIPGVHRATVRRRERTAARMFDEYIERNGRPDVLHAQGVLWGGAMARAIHRDHGIPWLVTAHASTIPRGVVGKRDRAVARETLLDAGVRCAVSESLAADLDRILDLDGAPFEMVPNPVDEKAFPLVEGGTSDEWSSVGNLVEGKGHDILLDAFAEASGVRLRIVGDGPLRQRMERRAETLGIADRVSFLGAIPRDRIQEAFHGVAGLVHASGYETFGIVVVEAMMSGLPVVCTRCGGPEGIVTEESGILVPVGDASRLAAAIEEATTGSWDRERIRTLAQESFGIESYVLRMRALFERVIADHA